MIALLLKDIYVVTKQIGLLLFFVVVFGMFTQEGMAGFAIVYASLLPMTALSYDERAKWDRLAATMPYSAFSIVFGKYLLGYLFLVVAAVLCSGGQFLLSLTGLTSVSLQFFFTILGAIMGALLLLAITLPLQFRFGVEKGRMFFLVAIGAMVGLTFAGLGPLAEKLTVLATETSVGSVMIGAILLLLLLNVLSIWVSTKFYVRRTR